MTRSNDFVNWTSVDTILKVDLIDYAEPLSPDFRDQFYNMQVFRNGNDWWGCLNVLHNNDSGSIIYDTGQPGSTLKNNDQTIDLQLVYSHDGANWQRTNYRKPFIARQSNVKQLLGMGTIVDNEL